MAATLERLASDGWIAEATLEYGFVFIRREDERRLLMLSSPIRTVRRGNPSLRFHRGRSIRTPSTPLLRLAAVGLVVSQRAKRLNNYDGAEAVRRPLNPRQGLQLRRPITCCFGLGLTDARQDSLSIF